MFEDITNLPHILKNWARKWGEAPFPERPRWFNLTIRHGDAKTVSLLATLAEN
jgi:hypothetical protein